MDPVHIFALPALIALALAIRSFRRSKPLPPIDFRRIKDPPRY
jgi:hypothetical protein